MKMRAFLALLVVALAGGVVAGCGGGDHGSGHNGSQGDANAVDRAFVRLMVPHHQSAIEMAEIASSKGQHTEIKALAVNITSTQKAEIDQMSGIAKEIGTEIPGATEGMDHGAGHSGGDPGDLKTLGLDEAGAGMSMDTGALENAKPFDRAFIDMMVPHHQGAIRMAKVELAKGQNPELKSIAEKIVDAQDREIKEMNSWRTDWYGAPVPSTS